MACPAQLSRPGTTRSLSALIAAAVVLTAMASPAEAKRHHRRGGGGYSPPYAAMVIDVKTGKTLHAVNEDSLRHPASITKVMTLYMLFEQLERGRYTLESPLTISSFAASQAPSKLGLRPGSTISVEDAIKAIVTKSANDVACAIGENISGSESRFAEMMTAKAKALGMSRTNYANASGLPDSDQITTARDLTVLARAIQDRFPRYYRYFQTRSFAFRGRVIGNHNRLLGNVQGVDGIKTGYTRDSGFNLMTAAKLDDRQIVAIVLGGKSGASRDKIMADLVRANLPRAYAGNRQTPATIEVAERARPAVVADGASRTRTQVASADDEDVETTASTAREPLDISPNRATTTPGSAGARGRLPAAAQAYAPVAPASPFPTGVKSPARLASVDGPRTESIPKTVSGAKVTPTAWVIQLGAMDDEDKAKSMLAEARTRAGGSLSRAAPYTVKVEHGGATLYRARFSGFSEQDSAQDACNALKRSGFSCFATRS
ncbi:D-alanyl-D-alanine carboxypeptidase [Methylobacterium sp. J-090]|nr:D-alanyl-D-alanine carboxypeptidase [Methylobacterium sp. J-090]MCJ2080798.1 D-alanyl-D-alanine carboxypeptidase [Methylobacterium sp. J-090]